MSKNKCPNCNSENYIETISTEKCEDCGLCCVYGKSGPNKIYWNMIKMKWAKQKEEEEKDIKWRIENEYI